jgi:hypothetical protein
VNKDGYDPIVFGLRDFWKNGTRISLETSAYLPEERGWRIFMPAKQTKM